MTNQIACPRCRGTHRIRYGSSRGHRRWRCRACGRTFAEMVGTQAEAVTAVLARDLERSEVEIAEFWSFGGKKGDHPRRGQPILPGPPVKVSGGGA